MRNIWQQIKKSYYFYIKKKALTNQRQKSLTAIKKMDKGYNQTIQ